MKKLLMRAMLIALAGLPLMALLRLQVRRKACQIRLQGNGGKVPAVTGCVKLAHLCAGCERAAAGVIINGSANQDVTYR